MKPFRTVTTVAVSILVLCSAACAGTADDGDPHPDTGTGGSDASASGTAGASSGGSPSASSSSGGTGTASSSGSHGSSGNPASSSSSGSSTGSSGGADAGSDDPVQAGRDLCLQIINMDRKSLPTPSAPLTAATAQEACVDSESKADYTADTPHAAFGKCKERAQNECPDWPGPPTAIMKKCLADMWAEGPPPAGQNNHWQNMGNSKYTKVACGFYQTPNGRWWATQDFW